MICLDLAKRFWPILAILGAFGLGAWKGSGWEHESMQGKLDSLQHEYSAFVANTQAQGLAAEAQAKAKQEEYENARTKADESHKLALDSLTADLDQLRKQRAASRYVPPAPAASKRPDLACFDRSQLEQALRLLDAGVSGLLAEGDEGALSLNTAKTWAQSLK